jgi:hypothetical protein
MRRVMVRDEAMERPDAPIVERDRPQARGRQTKGRSSSRMGHRQNGRLLQLWAQERYALPQPGLDGLRQGQE